MEDMVYERLQAWCHDTSNQIAAPNKPNVLQNRAPTQLIFYRDGLGETQFQECVRARPIRHTHASLHRSR
jgi:hypothetical protein